jgi:hypothetical protein
VEYARSTENLDAFMVSIKSLGESTLHSSQMHGSAIDASVDYIKHPYIARLNFNNNNSIFVMNDMGTDLAKLISDPDNNYQKTWIENLQVRKSFFHDVVGTGLTMVEKLGRAHNDIRLSNIVMRETSFCLVDFDMCTDSIRSDCFKAKGIFDIEDLNKKLLLFTTRQIALVIFELCTKDVKPDDISDIWKEWMWDHGELEKRRGKGGKTLFESWIGSRTPIQAALFSESVQVQQELNKEFFSSLSFSMLDLNIEPGSHHDRENELVAGSLSHDTANIGGFNAMGNKESVSKKRKQDCETIPVETSLDTQAAGNILTANSIDQSVLKGLQR